MRRVCLSFVICLGLAAACFGQGTTSRIVGTVSDTSGAVIPGAKVTLTNEATGVTFSSTTTETGAYVFASVQVGSYRVEIEAAGFKKFAALNNRVAIGEPTTVNATLQVGA